MRKPTCLACLIGFCLSLAPVVAAGATAVRSQGKAGGAPAILRAGVRVQRDLPYVAGGHERQKLELYLPAEAANSPLIVWIHGGGWENSGKDRTPVVSFGIPWWKSGCRLSWIGN